MQFPCHQLVCQFGKRRAMPSRVLIRRYNRGGRCPRPHILEVKILRIRRGRCACPLPSWPHKRVIGDEINPRIFFPTLSQLPRRLAHPPAGRVDFLYAGNSQIHRPESGSPAVCAHRLSSSRIYGSFCRSLRNSLRASGSLRPLDPGRRRSAAHRHFHRYRHDENSRDRSRSSGLLVHGRRRAHRFRHVLLAALSDSRPISNRAAGSKRQSPFPTEHEMKTADESNPSRRLPFEAKPDGWGMLQTLRKLVAESKLRVKRDTRLQLLTRAKTRVWRIASPNLRSVRILTFHGVEESDLANESRRLGAPTACSFSTP